MLLELMLQLLCLTVSRDYKCRCCRFVLSIPDRHRQVPDRNNPFPISRNIDFVFPSDLIALVPIPEKKIQEQERLEYFPDRSRPFTSLDIGGYIS
jgi:hypothetical protein